MPRGHRAEGVGPRGTRLLHGPHEQRSLAGDPLHLARQPASFEKVLRDTDPSRVADRDDLGLHLGVFIFEFYRGPPRSCRVGTLYLRRDPVATRAGVGRGQEAKQGPKQEPNPADITPPWGTFPQAGAGIDLAGELVAQKSRRQSYREIGLFGTDTAQPCRK